MIKTAALFFVAATFALAQNPRTGTTPLPRANSDLQSIPAAAVEIGPNLYRYTDTSGKAWLYSRTPFGLSRHEDKLAPQTMISSAPAVAVADLGESVSFQVQTPFGVSRWVTRKADLTDGEQLLLLRQQLNQQQSKNQCSADQPAPGSLQETK